MVPGLTHRLVRNLPQEQVATAANEQVLGFRRDRERKNLGKRCKISEGEAVLLNWTFAWSRRVEGSVMLLNSLPSHERTSGWASQVSRTLLAVAVGALIGAVYGGLVMATHLFTTGRWDRSPVFALSSAGVGAVLGFFAGLASSLAATHNSGEHAPDKHQG
jgi:hypothetical protein